MRDLSNKHCLLYFFHCFRMFCHFFQIKSYPRNLEDTVRRKDTKRAEKRQKTKERKLKVLKAFEPPHGKTNKMTCAPSEDTDQPGHPPSLNSLHCQHEEAEGPKLPIKRTAETLTRLGGCPGWSVIAKRTCHFVGFVMLQLIFKQGFVKNNPDQTWTNWNLKTIQIKLHVL